MNRLLIAVNNLSAESKEKALANFVRVNPHYDGAHWEDVLDILFDSDAHLDLTEECESFQQAVDVVTQYWAQQEHPRPFDGDSVEVES